MLTRNRANLSSDFFCRLTALFGAVIILVLCLCTIIFTNVSDDDRASTLVLTTRYSLLQMQEFAVLNRLNQEYSPSLYEGRSIGFYHIVSGHDYAFNIDGNDVIVFLHIQKTAGTSFEKFLVNHLNISRPCLCKDDRSCNGDKKCKKCKCFRPRSSKEFWLYSRYSTGWVCGLHADYTELFVSQCVDKAMDKIEGEHRKRRYFYTTYIRGPIDRFISEYRHVERGATWNKTRHICNGKPATAEELPSCYDPSVGWANLTLNEFLSCPYNLAFNRQTRMLADLTLTYCYDRSKMSEQTRNEVMLESAKNTLRGLAFFGIQNRMAESQELFETTFKMRFSNSLSNWNISKSEDTVISPEQLELIKELNYLDIQLFEYATELFNQRLKMVRELNPGFNQVPFINETAIPSTIKP